MLPKTFIFFAVSCLTVASAAKIDDKSLNSGNGNFIIQLNQTTCIKDFVPKFIDGAFEIFSQSLGEHNFEKRNNGIVRRDSEDDQVHIFDAYDIGNSFKGISVKFEELDIVKSLLRTFNHEIIKIIPDVDIKVKLPSPKKSSIRNKRAAEEDTPIVRQGNFNYDHLEHDENCTHNLKKRGTSNKKKSTPKKKKTNKKVTAKTIKKASSKKGSSNKTVSSKSVVSAAGYSQQPNAEWNLARISQRGRPDYRKPYVYSATAGAATTVYVLDDGMNYQHADFEGRARWGWSAFQGEPQSGGGHGTHVAGTIGGRTYGVAKKTKLIAVQVLNARGSGSVSGILAGLQWAADHRSRTGGGRSVINMSLGVSTAGMPYQTLAAINQAISAVVRTGIPIVVAAGNDNIDACNVSPASNQDVYTVAASGVNDDMSNYSNHGRCVQIIAPGTNVKSTYIGSTTSTAVMSGTSMASPHVAGVAALLMTDLQSPTPANAYRELSRLATRNIVYGVRGSTPNMLLFNGAE